MEKPDREIDVRKFDGLITSWYLRENGSTYITVLDDRAERFDVIEDGDPHKFAHPQLYLGELTVPDNVELGTD
jgi:hypothetical protein